MMAGASQKRSHRPTGGGFVGANVVKTLAQASKDRGIDVRTMAKADELIVKDGKVVGVKYTKGKNSMKSWLLQLFCCRWLLCQPGYGC